LQSHPDTFGDGSHAYAPPSLLPVATVEAASRTRDNHPVAAELTYPFVPKSNRRLRAGQFWSIPLRDGRFAAGRVMATPAFGEADRTGVVIGLIDWVGTAPPTESDISGRSVLVQAKSRYEAISKTGGEVLGMRSLDLDGLIAAHPNDNRVGAKHTVWGWATIVTYAERLAAGEPVS
jgi:hypothetical protein